MEEIIKVDNLTKDYGFGRGVFDVSFVVNKGECFGFLGPNGAGKTTTIRHIMGYSKPQKGATYVYGQNTWENYDTLLKDIGYLPGEIALPENLTGDEFIKMMADLRGVTDMTYTNELIKKFELDPKGSLKRMSAGMKRKLAIVTAFMHDPAVLVLDEPTSALDPVMQKIFIDFILEQKERGKTILLSSHIFNEIDATCDRIAIIKDGRIVSTFVADELKNSEIKTYAIGFVDKNGYDLFLKNNKQHNGELVEIASTKEHRNSLTLHIHDDKINELIEILSTYNLRYFAEMKFTLEDFFMEFYDKERKAKAKGFKGGSKNGSN